MSARKLENNNEVMVTVCYQKSCSHCMAKLIRLFYEKRNVCSIITFFTEQEIYIEWTTEYDTRIERKEEKAKTAISISVQFRL